MSKWTIYGKNVMYENGGVTIADCPKKEHAEQIVREHNVHDELVNGIEILKQRTCNICSNSGHTGFCSPIDRKVCTFIKEAEYILQKAKGNE